MGEFGTLVFIESRQSTKHQGIEFSIRDRKRFILDEVVKIRRDWMVQ